jgi:polyadenylate-binding protein
MLYEVFNPVAPVASIRVCRHHVTQESLGYAYVNFHSPADADRVLNTMNYTLISGAPCRIMWSQRDASSRRNGKGNIFIKNLNPEIDVQMLHDTFSKFGNVLSCKVALTRDGKPKGYGFVAFTNDDEATAAIKAVDGKKMEGFQVQVQKYLPRADRSRTAEWNNIFVKDFPTTWTEEQLRAKFEAFGKVTSIHFPTKDDASVGFAFVCFDEHSAATAAVEKLNGEMMKLPKSVVAKGEDGTETSEEVVVEKPLFVGRAQKKSERQRDLEVKRSHAKSEREQMLANRNLYVRNLDESITEELLQAEFEKYGKVVSVRIPQDDKGRSKLYGYVCFENQQDAAEAESNMNNQTLAGKPIAVFAWLSRAARKTQNSQNKKREAIQGAGPAAFYGAAQRGAGRAGMNPMMMMQQMQQMQQAMMSGQMSPQQTQQVMMQFQQMQQMMYMSMMQHQAAAAQHGMAPGQTMPPQAQQMMMQQQQAAAARAAPGAQPQDSRSMAEVLAQSTPEQQRQIIGSALYRAVQQLQHDDATARKLTGMLLDSTGGDTSELLNLVESPADLRANVEEALNALRGSA